MATSKSFYISSILASDPPKSTSGSRVTPEKGSDEVSPLRYELNQMAGVTSYLYSKYNQATLYTAPDLTPPQSPTETTMDGSLQYLDPRVYSHHRYSLPSPHLHHEAPSTPGSSPDRSGSSDTTSPLRSHADEGCSLPDRTRSNRMSYSRNQVRCLEAVFLRSPYPDSQAYEILAEELGLPEKKLKIWFQNKRARSKHRRSDQHRTQVPTVHPQPYMLPSATLMPAAFPSYPYVMPGMVMTQHGLVMTPPPEMQMMQHPVFSIPAPGSPTMVSAHAQHKS